VSGPREAAKGKYSASERKRRRMFGPRPTEIHFDSKHEEKPKQARKATQQILNRNSVDSLGNFRLLISLSKLNFVFFRRRKGKISLILATILLHKIFSFFLQTFAIILTLNSFADGWQYQV
jgi:hypothetical protein